jgi:hypothetical protein
MIHVVVGAIRKPKAQWNRKWWGSHREATVGIRRMGCVMVWILLWFGFEMLPPPTPQVYVSRLFAPQCSGVQRWGL